MRGIVLLVVLMVLTGCTAIRPTVDLPAASVPPTTFRYDSYDRLLSTFVDGKGQVDYAALNASPEAIESFYAQIIRISPDSHPELFPDDNSRLAYWINAYNGIVMKAVLDNYPIQSVRDVKAPILSWITPAGSGFFLFQRITLGGATTSLYFLENGVIRKRFEDPRYHFALNCASQSCPELPREAFVPDRLDQQLEREARKFIGDQRNFTIDHAAETIYLSSIFKWYRRDFTRWLEAHHPENPATLPYYVALYLPEDQAKELRQVAGEYRVKFLFYDWSLNDQALRSE